ncbi:MAG: tail protein X [Victivallales bacterium]|nr:tail protein X [Victivallales bacterium]
MKWTPLSFLLMAMATAQALVVPLPRPQPPLPPIEVKFPRMENVMPIQVSEVDIEAEIDGILAETQVTLRLRNPNARVLEGELCFPLPAGATVCGYALDINGQMVDGVIVEKEKARAVFDEVVRQGVDPGLAEQVGGNVFRTKVYPLPAGGSRTVRVKYVSTIQTVTVSGLTRSYYVQPLNFPDKLSSFRLKLQVAASQKPPMVVSGSLGNLEFSQWKTVYAAKTELHDLALTEDLYVAVMPRAEEHFLHQPAADGTRYFSYSHTVNASQQKTLPRPEAPVILWDASQSREKSDHEPELAFLRAAFAKAQTLTLVTFRNEPDAPVVFSNANDLCKALEQVIYDGGTNLESALLALPASSDDYLFTDGLDNYSLHRNFASTCARLSVLTADKQQNLSALQALPKNGVCLDLRNLSLENALALLDSPMPRVSAILADGKPLDIAWQFADGRLAAAGALPDKAGKLTVELALGTQTVTREVTVSEQNGLQAGSLLRTNYGQLKINTLLATGAPDAEVTATGKLFGLVTPGTSLLVLDTLAQYLRYRIRPPECLAEMRRQYDAKVKNDKSPQWGDSFQLLPNSPEKVLKLWTAFLDWYTHDFPKVRPAVASELQKRGEEPMALGAAAPARQRDGVLRRSEARVADANFAREDAMPAMAAAESAMPAAPAKQEKANAPQSSAPKVVLKPWSPDIPYIQELRQAGQDAYTAYLKQRQSYGASAGFYMDCADFLEKEGQRRLALRVLSNLAEMELENKQVLRILGYKLRFWGELPVAEMVFRAVLKLAPEEPQSYRDLALTLDDQGKFQEAIDMMLHLVNFQFNSRFPEIELIALTEINRMLLRAERQGVAVKGVDKQFIKPIQTDLRVVINWDTDMSDMDLWVTDPFQEKCFYSHRLTATGGRNSRDFTRGYGPEEFLIRNAVKGKYLVQTDYYGTSTQKVLGPVTLYAEVFTNYGRTDETRQFLAFRLDSRKQVIEVATIEHDGGNRPIVHDRPFHYQVKKGDTLDSIAIAHYGQTSYVDAILALNPGLAKDKPLKIGAILSMPATNSGNH